MSVTTAIENISNHLKNAYDELQGLGADLTNVNKNIENISMVLDDIYDSMPQVSGEGTSLTLDDTRVGKIKSTLKGNTSQTTYSGKNLLHQDQYITTRTVNGITYTNNGDGTFNVSGTANANTNLSILTGASQIGLESGKTYYLYSSQPYNSSTFNLSIPYAQDDSQKYLTANNSATTSGTITNVKLAFYVANGTTVNAQNVKVMLVEDSTPGDYEPYVGGTASPNPSYPQPVNVVSGDNTINICGKNMCNPNSNIVNIYFDQSTKNFLYNGNYRSIVIPIKPNTTYTISRTEGYGNDFSIATSVNYPTSGEYATNISVKWSASILTNTITSGANDNYFLFYFGYQTSQSTSREWLSKTQLEVGSSATSYELYQGNTYNINLPEGIELCKIGNYQDYFYKDNGKWYLHKEIGKVVLNGTQNIPLASGTPRRFNATYTALGIDNVKSGTTATDTQNNYRMCDHFGYASGQQTWGNYYLHNNWLVMLDSNSVIASASDLKNWLTSNQTAIYYVLETPTTNKMEYQPLIDQLNELEKTQSKENQTNISQTNNDLPFIIKANALLQISD